MANDTKNELLKAIDRIRMECDRLESQINEQIAEKEWYTTAEFAEKVGLSPGSVSTYCSSGRIDNLRRNTKGYWEIHKSEIANY